MGIKRLKGLLKSKAPNALQTRKWSSFAGKRVVIDVAVLIHSYTSSENLKAISRSPDLSQAPPNYDQLGIDVSKSIIKFLTRRFLEEGVTPVVVFDGRPSEQKQQELDKRDAVKLAAEQKLAETQQQFKGVSSWEGRLEAIDTLGLLYKKQHIYPQGVKGHLITQFKELNIEWYQAIGEADELCASLVREGRADAVYSTDSDQLAYLTPLIITKIGGSKTKGHSRDVEESCEVVVLSEALEGLKTTEAQFVDLCILLGTDYNLPLTMKGKGDKSRAIDRNKLLTSLLSHGSIEAIGSEFDLTSLNHLYCRQQFAYKPSESLILK